MKNWIKRLFHLHEYEVVKEVDVDVIGQFGEKYSRFTIIQRCKHCGKITVDKIRV